MTVSPSGLTFVLYLAGSLLLLPAGAFWSSAERSRAGTLVLTVACVAISSLQVGPSLALTT